MWFFRSGFLLQWKRAWPGLPDGTSVLVVHPVSKHSLCTDCLGGERADCFSSAMDGHWSEAAPPVVSRGHTWTNCQRSDGQCGWVGIFLVYCRNQRFSAFSLHTVTSHPPLFAQFRYVADACRDRGSSLGPSGGPTQTSSPRWKPEFDPVTGQLEHICDFGWLLTRSWPSPILSWWILCGQCQINLKDNNFPTFVFLQLDVSVSCSLSDGLSFSFFICVPVFSFPERFPWIGRVISGAVLTVHT